jgi:hypothetical protein
MSGTKKLNQFERDLPESIRQAKSIEHVRVHTPVEIRYAVVAGKRVRVMR